MKDYYYILDGKQAKPVEDAIEWGSWYEKSNRSVDKTKVIDCEVSTVFLGINHAFLGGEPILFETMIFGGQQDGYCQRYSTWEEAEVGHQKAIELLFEVNQ